MLAEGLRLHPGLLLDKVTILKEDLEDASKEDIRVIWDALSRAVDVLVKLDSGHQARDTFKKTEGE